MSTNKFVFGEGVILEIDSCKEVSSLLLDGKLKSVKEGLIEFVKQIKELKKDENL